MSPCSRRHDRSVKRPVPSPLPSADLADKKGRIEPDEQVNAGTGSQPLDSDVVRRFLDGCVKATEMQLAEGGRKNGAVREIERLVEKVVVQAGLGG